MNYSFNLKVIAVFLHTFVCNFKNVENTVLIIQYIFLKKSEINVICHYMIIPKITVDFTDNVLNSTEVFISF